MRLVDLAGEKKFGEKWSMKSSLERECSEIANSLKILKQMDPKLRSRVTVLRYEVTNLSYYGITVKLKAEKVLNLKFKIENYMPYKSLIGLLKWDFKITFESLIFLIHMKELVE